MNERRLESRFLCADLVRVGWIEEDRKRGQNGGSRTIEGVLEDISHAGGCVQVEEAIPLNAQISVRIGESTFAGRVSYCTHHEYGYFVGIHFSNETTWSCEQVMPQHLTNLQTLGSQGQA